MASSFNAIKNYLCGPRVKGSLIYENLSHNCRYTGLHGTRLHRIKEQIEKGKLDQHEKDFYVYSNWEWNAGKAAFWAKNKKDAVILEVGSDQPTIKNRAFNTLLFPKENQDLKILRVWKVSHSWLEKAWRHPPSD
ncbi:hypothetical protein [Candidatus Neptunichlamydia sp. REUL1]|uniref:hypothetical protein n=1 Tax=Candidatus Neptunichlamydia sp. REUL1 TaxID=3064277 RepID=UPI00292F724B|nr:hypothetical protein [Candidatus Neptunochlamydia sp. REUL1]